MCMLRSVSRSSATSPKEAAELFEKGLDKAFRKYDINDAIGITDCETGYPQTRRSKSSNPKTNAVGKAPISFTANRPPSRVIHDYLSDKEKSNEIRS